MFCLQRAVERASEKEAARTLTQTYKKYDVTLDEILCRDRHKVSISDSAAGRWDHSQETGEDGLGLLELIELNERVQKGYRDQDATEIRVLEVFLVMKGVSDGQLMNILCDVP